VETGKLCLTGAYIDLHWGETTSRPAVVANATVKSSAVFQQIADRLKSKPDLAKTVNAVYLFNITAGGAIVAQFSKYTLKSI